MTDPLFFDEAADEQQVRALSRRRRAALLFGFYPVSDDFYLRCRKIAREQCLANVFGDADDQRRLALQRCTAALEDRRDERPSIVVVLGRVATMKGDHQRQLQGAGNRQGECTAAPEMGMDQPRPQPCEIRDGREAAELLEHHPIDHAGGTGPAEQNRISPEIGQAGIRPTADPNRNQMAKADILPAQEMSLRAWDDAIPIDEYRGTVGQRRCPVGGRYGRGGRRPRRTHWQPCRACADTAGSGMSRKGSPEVRHRLLTEQQPPVNTRRAASSRRWPVAPR